MIMMTKKSVACDERRQTVRADRVFAIKHCLVRRNARSAPGLCALSTTRNMSATGLLFLSETFYKVGDIIHVNVVVSGIVDVVNGNARVVRVVENGSTSFDVAVHFIQDVPPKRAVKSYY
jgi:hypothetical protein